MCVKLLVEHYYNRIPKGKDPKSAREDLKEVGIMPELYAEEIETGTNLPVAATTLSKVVRKEFCQFLHDLKVP
jgi:hypothetical protein